MRVAIITTDSREHFRDYTNPCATFGTAPAALLEGLSAFPEVEVHVLSCAQRTMRSQERLAPNIWFHSLFVPHLGWLRTGYQGCIRAVRRELRQIQPDIVHGQGTERDCALDAVFSGFPNVITIHGNMRIMAALAKARPFSYPWFAAKLERLTIPRSQGVVCITRYTQQEVAGLASRCWIVPNAVDRSFFDLEARPAGLRPKILCVGVIYPRKNQNALVLSLDRLAAKLDFELVFLGDGSPGDVYFQEFQRLIAARPWCSHQGYADREQLKKHFHEASLVVLPSHEDNCPMVVLEAMAAGVPVVASRVGGVPELIEAGTTGLLCDPTDQTDMCAQVERILCEPGGSRAMAARAKTHAQECFHPTVVANLHIEIYREICAGVRQRCLSKPRNRL